MSQCPSCGGDCGYTKSKGCQYGHPMPNNPSREAFEAEFSQPPYEFEMDRYNEDESWPGSYRNYHVQCTWEGWQAGAQAERERAAKICEAAMPGGRHLNAGHTKTLSALQDVANAIRDRSAP